MDSMTFSLALLVASGRLPPATSTNSGKIITIPKELFVALSDFLKTRKCPGSVTIEFRRDEIVGVETVTKNRFPSKLPRGSIVTSVKGRLLTPFGMTSGGGATKST